MMAGAVKASWLQLRRSASSPKARDAESLAGPGLRLVFSVVFAEKARHSVQADLVGIAFD